MVTKSPLGYLVLCIFGSLFLQNVEGDFQVADSVLDGALSELLYPLHAMTSQLEEVVAELKQKGAEMERRRDESVINLSKAPVHCQNDILKQHATVLLSWSFDQCVTVTDDLVIASNVAWDLGVLAINITETAGTIGGNILDCPGWNPSTTITCFNENLRALKKLVTNFKSITQPHINKALEILKKIRYDFDSCLGIPLPSSQTIDEHLKSC